MEARRDSFEHVRRKLGNLDNVSIHHKAVCYPAPSDGKIKLYLSANAGKGDSIHRCGPEYEVAPAVRLTDFPADNHVALGDRITLLRMNIEGAEHEVIKDLVDSGNVSNVDGYYGTWETWSTSTGSVPKSCRLWSNSTGYPECCSVSRI